MQMAADDRREEVDVPLVKIGVLQVLARSPAQARACVHHVYGTSGFIELARIGAANRTGPNDKDVYIQFLRLVWLRVHAEDPVSSDWESRQPVCRRPASEAGNFLQVFAGFERIC